MFGNSIFRICRDAAADAAAAATAGGGGGGTGTAEAAAAAAAAAASAGDWRTSLAPEFRDLPGLKIFKTQADLEKSYWNSQKMLGADPATITPPKDANGFASEYVKNQKLIGQPTLKIPTKDATPQELNDFWTKLGRPESADKYVLPEVKLPEGIQKDANLEAGFKSWCHKHNVLPNQAAGLYQDYQGYVATQIEASRKANVEAIQTAETALRNDWGAAYGQKVELAKKVVALGGPELAAELEKAGVFNGNNPVVLKFFATLGEKFGEEALVGAGGGGPAMTPEAANKEYNKVLMDPTHPYNNQFHPEHKEAMQYMQDLFAMANPQLAEKR